MQNPQVFKRHCCSNLVETLILRAHGIDAAFILINECQLKDFCISYHVNAKYPPIRRKHSIDYLDSREEFRGFLRELNSYRSVNAFLTFTQVQHDGSVLQPHLFFVLEVTEELKVTLWVVRLYKVQ